MILHELKTVSQYNVKEMERREFGTIDHPGKVAEIFNAYVKTAPWYDAEKECLVVFLIDSKMRVKGWNLVSLGILNQTVTHAREVYRCAVAGAAAYIIIAHNHPSGDSSASQDDIRITQGLVSAGRILGIQLLDHVIVGVGGVGVLSAGWQSIKQCGVVDFTPDA